MPSKVYCSVCGNENISDFWSTSLNDGITFRGNYYCSFSCFTKGHRLFFLIMSIVWTLFSSGVGLLFTYLLINQGDISLRYYFIILGIFFGIDLLFVYPAVNGFRVNIQKFDADGQHREYPNPEDSYNIPKSDSIISCPKCNSHIREDKVFCPFCGYDLKNNSVLNLYNKA